MTQATDISHTTEINGQKTTNDTAPISRPLIIEPSPTYETSIPLQPDNHETKTNKTKTKTYEYRRAVKIVSQRNNNEQTKYLIQWEDRSLPDTWCNAADVDDNLRKVFYLTHTNTGAIYNELLEDTIQTTLSIQNNSDIQVQEPQPTKTINTQNIRAPGDLSDDAVFDSIRQKTPGVQRSPILTTEASLNIIGQQKGKRTKPVRVAIQILQQDIKHDKIRYFMRWENPHAERSWCWAEDVNEDLKRTFYTNNPLEVTPEIMSMSDTNKATPGEVMSH